MMAFGFLRDLMGFGIADTRYNDAEVCTYDSRGHVRGKSRAAGISKTRRTRKDTGRQSFRAVMTNRLGFEPLEARQLLSVATLNFTLPATIANQGVSVGIYSNTSNLYLDPKTDSFLKYQIFQNRSRCCLCAH